ncbi:MAG: branched-chain amino acid ABC transporter permease [Chloroflexota bacterium]
MGELFETLLPWRSTIIQLCSLATVLYLAFRVLSKQITWVDAVLIGLRVLVLIFVIIGAAFTLMADKYSGSQWVSLFVAGLAQGSIYALIALGYTLVYGILLMINFAHGEVYMAGAFTTYFLADATNRAGYLDISPAVTILVVILWVLFAALVSMGIAVLLERIAYRPLRGAPRLVPLITAIGASFFLQYTFRGFFGSGFQSYPEIDALKITPTSGTFMVGQFPIPIVSVLVFVASMLLMLALYWLVEYTKMGKAMRAVSENKEVARLMGIDIDKVIVFTFAVGGALAGAAGVIGALYRPQGINFFMGFFPGIKAFTAAVLGGIGSVPGALLGGLFLGIFESILPNLVLDGLGIPSPNQLKDVIAYTMLVFVLIFRPQGIIGEKLAEKKA